VEKRESIITVNKINLFIIISVLVLFVSAVGYLYYRREENQIRQRKNNELKTITELKIHLIEEWHKERIKDAHVITKSPFILEKITRFINNPDNKELKEQFIKRLSISKVDGQYRNLILSNTEGKSLLSLSPLPHGLDSLLLSQVAETARAMQVTDTDIYYNGTERKICYDIIAPIIDSSKKTIAVIILQIDPEYNLFPKIQAWPLESRTSEAMIVRKEGDSVLFLNSLKFKDNSKLNMRIPLTRNEISAVQAVRGARGIVEGNDYRGEKVLAYVSGIKDTKWLIITKMDREELYSEIYTLWGIVLGISLALIFLCILGIILFYSNKQKNIYKELFKKEKELWESHEEFKVTVDSIGDGVITTDISGKVKYMNRLAEELTGWKLRDARGRLLDEIYKIKNEETGLPETHAVNKVLELGIVKGLANHTILISKNGKEIAIMDTGAPICNANGEITGIVLTLRDETEKRKQQRELKESEELFSTTFRTSPVGITLFRLDDGKYLEANDSFFYISGYSREEIIGHTVRELNLIADEEEIENYLRLLKREGKFFGKELKFRKRSGELGIALISAEMLDYRNEKYVLSVLYDITARKKVEEDLMASEAKYRNTLDNMLEGCQILSYDWRYVYINDTAARQGKLKKEDYIGSSFFELYPDVEKTALFNKMNTCMQKRAPQFIENEFVYPDGTIGYFELMIQPVPEGIFILSTDVTNLKRSERELVINKNRFDRLISELNEIVWTGTKEGKSIIEINNAFEKIYGVPVDEIKKNPELWFQMVLQDDKEIAVQSSKELFEKGYSEAEYRIVRPDKSIRWIYDRKSVIYDREDAPKEIGGIASDITERKKMIEELNFTVQILTFLNSSGTLSELVKGIASLFKNWYNFEAVGIRLKDGDDYPYFETRGFSEEFVELENSLCVFNSSGKAVKNENGEPELECMCGSILLGRENTASNYITSKGSFWTNSTSELAASGEIHTAPSRPRNRCTSLGYESIALIPIKSENITHGLIQLNDHRKNLFTIERIEFYERMADLVANAIAYKISQEKLSQSERRYRRLFENMVEGYAYCKMLYKNGKPIDWLFISVNDAFEKLTGLIDVEKKNVTEVIPGIIEKDKEIVEIYSRVASSGIPEKFEIYVNSMDMWFLISVYSPEKEYFVAVFDVITERKKAEQALIEAKLKAEEISRLKSNLFANMSHELRTPFVGIMGYAELLREMVNDQNSLDVIDGILVTSKRLVDTLTKILNLTNLEFEDIEMQFSIVNLSNIINSKIEKYYSEAEKKNLYIKINYEDSRLTVYTIENYLKEIIDNMLSNAVKFTDSGGIEISVKEKQKEGIKLVQIEVKDTGIGIPADKQEIIWEEFRQASEGTTRSYQGIGLGLAISKRYCEKIGGKIYLKSEEKKGTSFIIELPI